MSGCSASSCSPALRDAGGGHGCWTRFGRRGPLSLGARALAGRILPRVLALVVLGGAAATAAEPPLAAARSSAAAQEPLPAERVPWRGSRVVGSPEPPPPYVARRAFPEARFHEPVLFVRAPGRAPERDRFFVGQRGGQLFSLADRPDARPELAIDLTKELADLQATPPRVRFDALYALAFHPRFEENRECFVCYTLADADRRIANRADGSRVARFRVTSTDPPRLDPASEQVLITWEQGGHNGCDLQFGPDGYLYISTGDARPPSPPDALRTGQDITDLPSSVLRIDVDRPSGGKPYGIPADNPFVEVTIEGRAARPEVWAYGFRNPWRMSFDRQTGQLWLADVGWELWELVHRVEKGGNYGWSVVEGRQPIHATDLPGPTPIRPPLLELPHTIAASITGGFVYRGKRFPELVGQYVFGDWEFRRLWAAKFAGDQLVSLTELTRPTVRVVTFGEDAQGELYFLDYDTGVVHTLEKNQEPPSQGTFPAQLSATGLFADVATQTPAPGVLPYALQSPAWQDGATSQRWIALPETSSVRVYPSPGKPMPSQVYWHSFRLHFPANAVLVRTLSLPRVVGSGETSRRIETQLLHFDGADWRAYSYAWRDDQMDADLVAAAGAETTLRIPDPGVPGGQREYVWRFHDRTQCLQCHSQWPQYAIGFSLAQLNCDIPAAGGRANQLGEFSRLGILQRRSLDDQPLPPYDQETVKSEPRLADPFDPSAAPLADRARSYLHANCSHCHRFNGGGIVGLDLLFDKPLPETHLVQPPVRGDFGLTDARIVAPGAPERSTLYFRLAKFGRDRMPHVGVDWPDEAGLRLVADWIESLDPAAAGRSSATPLPPLDQALAHPEAALRWARRMAREELDADTRAQLLAAASRLEPGFVRDLFEGYLPPDGRGRKLGPRPRPETILTLSGNAERGGQLFWATATKCGTCHRVGERGVALGPDLTQIGTQRPRAELLDSLLQPSRTIDPRFAAYSVIQHDGRSATGLLVRRDAAAVVLRDAQNKEVVVPAREVERVVPSKVSLMPEGLLAFFTPQEAADLVEYLTTLRAPPQP